MKKFVIYTDYVTGEGPACGYSYSPIEAKDIVEAMEIADRRFSKRVYLMRIMEKVSNIQKGEGCKFETYEATLCRRSHGWHRNTAECSEASHKVNKNWLNNNKNVVWFDIVKG